MLFIMEVKVKEVLQERLAKLVGLFTLAEVAAEHGVRGTQVQVEQVEEVRVVTVRKRVLMVALILAEVAEVMVLQRQDTLLEVLELY